MAKVEWIFDGRKASELTVARALAEARAARLRRAGQIRAQLREELGVETDSRELTNLTRRKLREEEAERRMLDRELRKLGTAVRRMARELQKPVYARAKPFPLRENSERENQRFDTMFPVKKGSARKGDGLYSFHCKFTSRGFGERRKNRSRVYRRGEAVKHLRYIIRELARELSQGGLVSNISLDPGELAAFFDTVEQLEAQDRENANVYMSLVVSLPHELTPEGRERALAEICAMLAEHDLPYVGVLHAPDPRGDPRNFHAHMMFSLRPCEIADRGHYAFSCVKLSDLNDATFIEPFRRGVAEILNAAMEREGHHRRFTALSDADRGLEPRTKSSGKSTPGQKHWERKQEDLALIRRERDILARRDAVLARLARAVAQVPQTAQIDRSQALAAVRSRTCDILENMKNAIETAMAARSSSLRDLNARVTAVESARLRTREFGDPQLGDTSSEMSAEQAKVAYVLTEAPSKQAVAHAQPVITRREPRGSSRRKAIAAAVRRLRHANWPAQTRTERGYALSPDYSEFLRDVDRFEAEPAVQTAHRIRWQKMLGEVQQRIDNAERSPFVESEGRPRLEIDFLPGALRSALASARGHSDVEELLAEARSRWQERMARERDARRLKAQRNERRKAEAKARLGPLVAEVLGRVERDVTSGRIPSTVIDPLRLDIRIMAKSVAAGEVVMVAADGRESLYFASEGLRSIAEQLANSRIGQTILRRLCQQTLGNRFDPADLPVLWTIPVAAKPPPASPSGVEVRDIQSGKDLSRDP